MALFAGRLPPVHSYSEAAQLCRAEVQVPEMEQQRGWFLPSVRCQDGQPCSGMPPGNFLD